MTNPVNITNTVGVFVREAVNHLDGRLGEGYSLKNPTLIGAIVQSMAEIYKTQIVAESHLDKGVDREES